MPGVVNKIGFWSGLIAFMGTVAFYIVQMLQVMGLLKYPWDEILIYGFSLCIPIPFLLEMLALHYLAETGKKFYSHAAVLFTLVYLVFVTANYVVQLATVIPMTVQGRANEILILSQTPHSLFWDFDAIGYIFMGIAALCTVPLWERIGSQRWARYAALSHALVTPLISFVYFYPHFSNRLLLIATPWAITAPLFMLLIALQLRKLTAKTPGNSMPQ